ncbi:MAG: ABC transporter ATP-binding protein [Oscillospiraceae bacterium]|nr:ABC transporter ATP-binding protein [Candidatus Ruminococcus equi]
MSKQVNEKKKKNSVYKRLFSYMKPYKVPLIFSIIFVFIGCFVYALAPLMLGNAINNLKLIFTEGYTAEVSEAFFIFLITMISCYLLYSIFTYLATHLIVACTENTIYDLRKAIDTKLNKLPLNYYDTTTYGDILSRVTNDIDTISNSLQSSLYQIINACFTVVIVIIMMLGVSGWLTIVGLLAVPFILYISAKIAAKSQVGFDKQMELTGELNGYVEEYYGGHNVVTVFGKEEEVIGKFEETNDTLYETSNRAQFLAGILMPLSQSMSNIGFVLVALVGALIAIAGGLSVGMIQAFTQYLTQFSTPITEVMQISGIIQSTSSAATRIFEFLDEQEEVADTENPKFPEPLKGQVTFDHVKFGYLPHQTLIHDLDIKINAGEKTAIVGPTGAGKTTLVNLIMRFYDVKGGGIRIDGVDVREMKRERLREIFGMVLQETWLYSGTIMENIRYGKLDATDEEVIAAAKAARADAFIRTLPGGYNFVLQEGASNIAQGQRQLITIARAMLNDPPIMILDEATSSVDTRTEVLIQDAMAQMMKGRTSFVIAHRLSTIKDSDNILYMQDGDILEVGNHEELMAKDGLYAKLYNSQFADNNG